MNRIVTNLFPEESNPVLRRVYLFALAMLLPVTLISALWGVDYAASALAGGLLILLCGLWTHAAVKGVFSVSARKMKRRLWWRVAWRFILLAITLYAILHAPWLRLTTLIAGLSLFVPAIMLELIVELVGQRQQGAAKEDTTTR
jgi:hypothetical protein